MTILKKPILFIILNSVTLYAMDILLPGVIVSGGIWGYVVAAIFIGLLNVFVKPIVKVLSLPFIFLTFGLFLIVINAAILYLTHYLLGVFQFGEIALSISGILDYILAAILFSLVHTFFGKIFR